VSAWTLSTARRMLLFEGRMPIYDDPVLGEYNRPNGGVGRRITPPASRRTEREALTSLSSHQENTPVIPSFQ
jgi:hypothetical protein